MPALTIAQLVAVISTDTAALDARLGKLETDFKAVQSNAEKAAEGVSKAFASSAKGVDSLEQANKKAMASSANLAKFEYETGQRSATNYKEFLTERIKSLETYTTAYRSTASQIVTVNKAIDTQVSADTKAFNQKAAVLAKQKSDAAILQINREALAQREALASFMSRQFQEVAAETKAEAEKKILDDQRKAAISNLAKFEYEQGRLSAEAYKVFLQRKLASLEEYTTAWKSTASQIVSIETAQYDAILAKNAEFNAQRIAAEKEYAAMHTSIVKQTNDIASSASVIAAGHNESAKSRGAVFSGIANLAGTGAAAVATTEALTAILSSGFDHALTGIANNTLMTNADINTMRESVLSLGKETGQPLEDIARGFMHVSNFGNNATDSTKILRTANQEAVATMSSTETVANALATSLSIFGANANQAAGYMDVLHHSAAAGNLTVQDFVSSSGPALAIAAEMHDKFYDAATAISILSKSGFDASEASTQIKSLIAHMADPSDKSAKYIRELSNAYNSLSANKGHKIDLTADFSEQGIAAKGLLNILRDIEALTGGDASKILKTTSALRGGIGEAQLAQRLTPGGEADQQEAQTRALQYENTGRETAAVFQRMMQDNQQQFKSLLQTLEIKFIPVGERAMQIFIRMEPLINKVADVVLNLMNAFQKLSPAMQETITLLGAGYLVAKFAGLFAVLTKIPVAFTTVVSAMLKVKDVMLLVQGGAATMGEGFTALIGSGGVIGLLIVALGVLAFNLYRIGDAIKGIHDANLNTALNDAKVPGEEATIQRKGGGAANLLESSKITDTIDGRKVTLDILENTKRQEESRKQNTSNIDAQIQKVKFDIVALGKSRQEQLDAMRDNVKVSDIPSIALSVADRMNATPKQRLALMEAGIVESDMGKNYSNDKDSRGFLQQRPSQGWGTVAQVMNPYYAARKFLEAAQKVKGQDRMTAGELAQAVQISGYPLRYDASQTNAERLIKSIRPSDALAPMPIKFLKGVPYAPPLPGTNNNNGFVGQAVTDADIANQEAKEKAEKAAERAAKTAQKALEEKYKSETQSLERVIILKGQSTDLDNQHIHYQELMQSLQNGNLQGLSGSKAGKLEGLANEADAADQKHRLDELIYKAKENIQKASLPSDVRGALTATSMSLSEWQSIGKIGPKNSAGYTKEQEQVLKASEYLDYQKAVTQASNALADFTLKQHYAGNAAALSAIEAMGGADKWNSLSTKIKDAMIHSAGLENGSKALLELQTSWTDKAAASTDTVKTNTEAAKRALDELITKYPAIVKLPNFASIKSNILGSGAKEDQKGIGDFFTKQNEDLANSAKLFSLSNKKSDSFDPGQKAVAEWESKNQDTIDKINQETGAIKALDEAKLKAYEQSLSSQTDTENIQTQTNLLQDQMRELERKNNLDPNTVYNSPGDKAVKEWVANNEQIIKALGATSQAVLAYEKALKESTNLDETHKALSSALSNVASGGASAVISGINSAFSPDSSARGSLQTTLYQQKQELLQYQVAEQEFKSKYPGNANDPYIDRLKNLQNEIGKTQGKINSMGNSLQSAFTRFFTSIYDSFKQMLVKMAEDYLKSQLTNYLQRQLGTGYTTASGGASGGSGISGIGGSILGIIGGLFGGGSKGSVSTPASAAPSIPANYAANGGMLVAGVPTWVNDSELIVPDAPGAILPLSKMTGDKVKKIVGNETQPTQIIHQSVTISTPDVQGFRSSRATVAQGLKSVMRTTRK